MPTEYTFRDILQQQPLYTMINLSGDRNWPQKIIVECVNCHEKYPFGLSSDYGHLVGTRTINYNYAAYNCAACGATRIYVVEFSFDENGDPLVRKIGQYPPWSVSVQKEVSKCLSKGDDELYRKALICVSQNFGMGACAYMRRVLEDQITPLLQMLYEIKREDGAGKKELEEIDTALKGKQFDRKLELAQKAVPPHLITEGVNPFKQIHEDLSAALHVHDEQEAVAIALRLRATLGFVVIELARYTASRASFKAAIKKSVKAKRKV
jgi:hypothetical protein